MPPQPSTDALHSADGFLSRLKIVPFVLYILCAFVLTGHVHRLLAVGVAALLLPWYFLARHRVTQGKQNFKGSAYFVAVLRAIGHRENLIDDAVTEQLLPPLVRWCLWFPPSRFLIKRISPSLYTYIVNRTKFIDEAVGEAQRRSRRRTQLVILGAGLDTRCYRMRHDSTLAAFEVDLPQMQERKIAALERARIDSSHVRFVACDFSSTSLSWLRLLRDAGFDPATPAIVVWEGVTMYIPEAAVRETLQLVGSLAAGSVIVFDTASDVVLKPHHQQPRQLRRALAAFRRRGEPIQFGVASENVRGLLQSSSKHLHLVEIRPSQFPVLDVSFVKALVKKAAE